MKLNSRDKSIQKISGHSQILISSVIVIFHYFKNKFQTDTLNPFETNGQIFNNHVNGTAENTETCTQSDKDKKDGENNVTLSNEQLIMLEDQRQELADLRRQVVYLQVDFTTFLIFE
jgi:hypothetical protein